VWQQTTVKKGCSNMAIEVVLTRLDATPEALQSLQAWLCGAERQRAARFHFERDRRRFIVARARLRQRLAACLGVRPEWIELEYGENGKPALARGGSHAGRRLHFNLAHCDDVALHAFSSSREIGIDVEAIRALPEADDIAARHFSRRENEAYRALAPQDRPLAFFRCWTRKEAYLKALGRGLATRLNELDVSQDTLGEDGGWRLESFCPLPGFIAALASRPAQE
jgi:4'-phosphopantetheinyl transferase